MAASLAGLASAVQPGRGRGQPVVKNCYVRVRTPSGTRPGNSRGLTVRLGFCDTTH